MKARKKNAGKPNSVFVDRTRTLLQRWKGYAALALSDADADAHRIVPVIYDRWLVDRVYRDSLAERLGYKNEDVNYSFVSDAGGGSSFSGVNPIEQPMSLVDRWSQADERYQLRELFTADKQLMQLAVDLFGEGAIPVEFHDKSLAS